MNRKRAKGEAKWQEKNHDERLTAPPRQSPCCVCVRVFRYESYVMGMVTNLESLPLQKIHNMLKMFVLEPVYDKTIAELETFLAKLVNDGKLTFDGLVYRKNKRR